MQSDSVENIFARAWTLLAKNPVLIVPGLVVGLAAGVIGAIVVPHPSFDPNAPTQGFANGLTLAAAAAISTVISILAFLLTQTYTAGMAGAAWRTGSTTLADGSASFREDAGRLLAAVFLLAVISIVIGLLTLGVGWYVVLFFALYMVPAVVIDNLGAIPAIKLSARIALRRLLTTIIIVVMIIVIGVVIGLVLLPLAMVPFIGPIIARVVGQAVAAYATLVIVGEYLSARQAPDITAGPSV